MSLKTATRGGRVNNLKFYHDAKEDEEILNLDFVSQYPSVMLDEKFPIEHPTVINEDFDYSLKSYFGFVHCTVKPPKQLYLPSLPININDRLLFPLCSECSLFEKQKCDCKDKSITSTWSTIELRDAITEDKYEIEEIYQVYHYNSTHSNVFGDFIKFLFKTKQESAGWPSWCISEEDKQKFIHDFYEKTGIKLEYARILKNPALYIMSKLQMNSTFGKFIQDPNKTQNSIVQTYDHYWELATNVKLDILDETMVTDNTLIMTYKLKDVTNQKIRR